MGTEAALLTILLMTSPGTPDATASRLAPVPGTAVRYVRSGESSLFFYSGRYYAFRSGAWFFAASDRGPWARIRNRRVPSEVRAVLAKQSRTSTLSASPRTSASGGW